MVRRKKIQAMVQTLLHENGITGAAVPVWQIARAKGARIYGDTLDGKLSGFLYRDKDQAVIGINTSQAKPRQNFTVAHELGHLLLHDQEQQLHVDHEFRVKLRSDTANEATVRLRNEISSLGTDEAEQEANFFAANLLMPKEFIERDLADIDYVDTFDEDDFLIKMAKKYEVSAQALTIRLKTLGYLQE